MLQDTHRHLLIVQHGLREVREAVADLRLLGISRLSLTALPTAPTTANGRAGAAERARVAAVYVMGTCPRAGAAASATTGACSGSCAYCGDGHFDLRLPVPAAMITRLATAMVGAVSGNSG